MEIFASAEFVPTEDITTYELARVLKFTLACSHGLGIAEPIRFPDVSSYNRLILEYNDIIKHFKIVVYGNSQKYTTDCGVVWDESGKRVDKNE